MSLSRGEGEGGGVALSGMTRHRSAALALAAVLALGACGGGDDDSSSDAPSATTAAVAEAPDETTAVTEAPAATEAPDPEPVSGDSGSEWCDGIRSGEDSGIGVDLFGATPEEIEAQFRQNVEAVERWESVAPPEIEDDVNLFADAFRTFVRLGEEADWDILAMAENPEFETAFDDPALDAASDRIDAYSRDVCGVDLGLGFDDGGAGDAPPPPSGPPADQAEALLGLFGLPADFLTEETRACLNEGIAEAFPDGVPEVIDAESAAAFDALEPLIEDCGLF